MKQEEFREFMAKMIQATGKELIDRAEDLVGDGDLICNLRISIDFPTDGNAFVSVPNITVSRAYACKECIKVFMEMN